MEFASSVHFEPRYIPEMASSEQKSALGLLQGLSTGCHSAPCPNTAQTIPFSSLPGFAGKVYSHWCQMLAQWILNGISNSGLNCGLNRRIVLIAFSILFQLYSNARYSKRDKHASDWPLTHILLIRALYCCCWSKTTVEIVADNDSHNNNIDLFPHKSNLHSLLHI